jgi:exonuclease SbcD
MNRPFTFFHLADLHLGRQLGGRSLLEDQEYFIGRFLEAVEEKRPDAVVIAGDLYDRAIASSEAISLCDAFLSQLSGLCFVLIVPGNHDAAERLTLLRGILSAQGIHIAADFTGEAESVRFQDAYGTVRFDLIPFVRPNAVRAIFDDDTITSTDAAVRAILSTVNSNPAERSVLVCHQFAVSGDFKPMTSDSEIVYVGTTDQVDITAFEGYDYVALGHLHRPQMIGHGHIRYAGSPLTYSLSEIDQEKSFLEVVLTPDGPVKVTAHAITPLRKVVRLEGQFSELLERGAALIKQGREDCDYIYAVLSDETAVLDAMTRLRTVYPNIVNLEFTSRPQAEQTRGQWRTETGEDDEAAFARFFELQTGKELTSRQSRIVKEALSRSRDRS